MYIGRYVSKESLHHRNNARGVTGGFYSYGELNVLVYFLLETLHFTCLLQQQVPQLCRTLLGHPPSLPSGYLSSSCCPPSGSCEGTWSLQRWEVEYWHQDHVQEFAEFLQQWKSDCLQHFHSKSRYWACSVPRFAFSNSANCCTKCWQAKIVA